MTEPDPTDDAYWAAPRTTDQEGCAACGEDHEMDYYPLNTPVEIGPVEHGAFVHDDARIIAAGVCHNDESVVTIWGEGWQLKGAYTLDGVCDCGKGIEDEEDARFCRHCRAPLPEHDYLFDSFREEH